MTKQKHLFFFVAAILLAYIHISISLQFSPYPVVLLPVLFLLISFFSLPFGHALFYSLLHALFLDLYSALPFGSYAVLFVLLLVGLYALTQTIFSQQSTLSTGAVCTATTVTFLIALRGIEHIQLSVFQSLPHTFFTLSFFWQLLLIVVVQSSILMFLHIIQKRERKFFLKPHIVE